MDKIDCTSEYALTKNRLFDFFSRGKQMENRQAARHVKMQAEPRGAPVMSASSAESPQRFDNRLSLLLAGLVALMQRLRRFSRS